MVDAQQQMKDRQRASTVAAPLLVFADDWGRHPSSSQHLIGHLLPRRQVVWVNTIMRPPKWNISTLRRGWEKTRQWARQKQPHGSLASNPQVCNPRMWPWFSTAWDRKLNRWLLRRQLERTIRELIRAPIAMTTLPITADLIGHLPTRRWVYYCVDDFSQWPGLDGPALQRMEQRLIEKVDDIIVVSETLQERIARLGRSSHLLTHGIEPTAWTASESVAPPRCLEGLERPLVVFWGVVDRRMDAEFVRRLGNALSRGTIVFAGPHDAPAPELLRAPRTAFVGSLPFADLPALAREASVLIMPYLDIPVTRAIQPLKLKEYLATGKPVVVRNLPATREWDDCLDLAADSEQFVQAVQRRLGGGLPDHQQIARQRLADETWEAKANQFELWIDAESARIDQGCE